VHGSFLTEAHIVALVSDREMGRKEHLATASFYAKELNEGNWGWQVLLQPMKQPLHSR